MSRRASRIQATAGLRIFLAALILVLVGAVTFFLIRRANRPPVVRPETKPLTRQKVDVKEGISFSKVTGGRNRLFVQAFRNYSGPDGLDHWAGRSDQPEDRVRIESRTRDGLVRFSASAREVITDSEWNHLSFQGGVVVIMEGITVSGTTFEFDQKKNVITSAVPVQFEGERFRGDCRRARYDVGSEKITLLGGLTLAVTPWANDPVPLVITGEEMTYEKSSRTGQVRGEVKLAHGLSRGRADRVDFAQFVDKAGFQLFEFRGAVTIDADERPANRPVPAKQAAPVDKAAPLKEEDLIFFQGGRQRLEAGVITLLPFPGEEWLHVISLKDGGRVEILNDDGRRTTIEAGELNFLYDRNGSLQDFNLRRNVRILGEAGKRVRLVEGPKIDFNANAGDLVVDGSGPRARSNSGGREVTAESMVINLRTNNFRMSGDVRIVSLPQPGEKRDAGLFAADQNVYMTAGETFYDAGTRLFKLSKRARLWQGRDSLEADDVEILEESGDLTALGSVRSVFFHRPKGKDRDERIEVTGNRLDRLSKTGRVYYEESCSLSVAAIVLRSGRLILEPAEEAGKFKRIYADGGRVMILQEKKKAEGDQADYDLVENLIVLTGRPVLEDKDKGVMRGGKLTFHPADGKISIENQDPERSTTVIKS